MNPEQKAGSRVGQQFQRELSSLLKRYLDDQALTREAQVAILAVLMAEATNGACSAGPPLETVLTSIRAMYADFSKRKL